MANPLSRLLQTFSCIEIALKKENKLPCIRFRRVEDVFAIVKINDVEKLKEIMNQPHPKSNSK